jgi:hypothetical protein
MPSHACGARWIYLVLCHRTGYIRGAAPPRERSTGKGQNAENRTPCDEFMLALSSQGVKEDCFLRLLHFQIEESSRSFTPGLQVSRTVYCRASEIIYWCQ